MQSNSLQARYIAKVERGTGAHGSAHLQISEFLSRTTILRAAGPEPTRNHHAETGEARCGTTLRLIYSWPASQHHYRLSCMHVRKGGGCARPVSQKQMQPPVRFCPQRVLEIVEDAADAFRGIMKAGRYEEIGFVQGQMSVQ